MDTNKGPSDFDSIPPYKITKEFKEYCRQVALYMYETFLNNNKKNDGKNTTTT